VRQVQSLCKTGRIPGAIQISGVWIIPEEAEKPSKHRRIRHGEGAMSEKLFKLEDFDSYREDNRREVKKAGHGLPVSLWDTYSAFANCDGGVIILGVAEQPDGSWATSGLKKKDENKLLKEFWDSINNPNKVNINLLVDEDVETYELDDDLIIVIKVPRARREYRPVYINNNLFGGTFRRNREGDYHCTPSEIRAMLRDEPDETPDMKILDYMDLSVIDQETLKGYRNRHSAWRPNHVFEKDSDELYLRHIGAAAYDRDGVLRPTAAGLLMFGHEYDIVREFPEYFLDYQEILDPSLRWTDRVQSSSGDWSGNLLDFFYRVNSKLSKDLKVPFKLDGIVRTEDTPVHRALREALINCLSNSDFLIPRGTVIRKEEDRIVFENPGSIRVGKKQMLEGGVSEPRNKTILKMFNLIGYGERAGSGVPDIFSVWESEGWKQPTVEEQLGPDRTIVTLVFEKRAKTQTKLSDKTMGENQQTKEKKQTKSKTTEQKITEYLLNKDGVTSKEIASYIGLSQSRTRTILREMKNVASEGTTNKRLYRLK